MLERLSHPRGMRPTRGVLCHLMARARARTNRIAFQTLLPFLNPLLLDKLVPPLMVL